MSEDCPHCVFEKTEANCRGCFEGSHYKPKPMTNADKIRSMTDEELAKMMSPVESGCPPAMRGGVDCSGQISCYRCWLDWLKQEVNDDP